MILIREKRSKVQRVEQRDARNKLYLRMTSPEPDAFFMCSLNPANYTEANPIICFHRLLPAALIVDD